MRSSPHLGWHLIQITHHIFGLPAGMPFGKTFRRHLFCARCGYRKAFSIGNPVTIQSFVDWIRDRGGGAGCRSDQASRPESRQYRRGREMPLDPQHDQAAKDRRHQCKKFVPRLLVRWRSRRFAHRALCPSVDLKSVSARRHVLPLRQSFDTPQSHRQEQPKSLQCRSS
jgi:hypothetical protein